MNVQVYKTINCVCVGKMFSRRKHDIYAIKLETFCRLLRFVISSHYGHLAVVIGRMFFYKKGKIGNGIHI